MDEDQELYENDEYYSDDEIDTIISETDDEYESNDYNPYHIDLLRPPIQWKLIKIDKAVLEVSSYGTIRPYKSLEKSTEGKNYSGTPYRYYTIHTQEGKQFNYLIHEIVWQAFNGQPQPGYEIRHKKEYIEKYRKIYSNRLHNLELVKKIEITPLQLALQ
jgi:hypothetical protein